MPITSDQLAAINAIITKINIYQQQLSDAFDAAFSRGDTARALQIHQCYTTAVDLQVKAANLKTQADLAGLRAEAGAFKAATDLLNSQKDRIEQVVNAVGKVASVLSTIAQIAAATASLMALL